MDIIPIPALSDNYIWLMINQDQHTAVAVDPGEAAPLMSYLSQHHLDLKAVLITHHHWDHTNGLEELLNVYPSLTVFGSTRNVPGVTNTESEVNIEHFPSFQMISIPGHTLDHVAYYSPGILFCGDTLFSAGCGRVFEGTMEQMYRSLQTLAALPQETRVYCGHEYTLNNLRFAEKAEPGNIRIQERLQVVQGLRNKQLPTLPSTLEEETLTNPFLRCDSPEIIDQVHKQSGDKVSDGPDVFAVLRKWKDGV